MVHPYDNIIDFIARGASSEAVAEFEASPESKEYVAELIHKEKTIGLTPEETSELDHYMQIENLMRLAKARAKVLSLP